MAIKYLDDSGLAQLVSDVKTYVGTQIGAIPNISYEVVNSLPTAGATYYFNTSKTVYLAPKSTSQTNNSYDEYICTRSGTEGSYTYAWEKIGDTEIDLSGYMTTSNPTGTGSLSLNRRANSTIGTRSVAVNYNNVASGYLSFAEGSNTDSTGSASHSEGYATKASGNFSHAEGYGATASGSSSHAEGEYTTAQRKSQHTFGEYNVLDTGGTDETTRGNYVEIVGNGTGASARSNARTLDWSGNEVLSGTLQTTGLKDGNNANYKLALPNTTSWTGNKTIATTDDVATKQDTLVSGTNIKTINNTSLLGSGNISISGGTTTDVQINSTSITSGGVADIKTNGTYNASTNKIATMDDVSVKLDKNTTNSSVVYVNSSTGNPSVVGFGYSSPLSGAIPQRDITGDLYVLTTPQNNNSATSKSYVDSLQMVPSDNIATYSTAPTTNTTLMTAPANGVAYVRYALQGSGSIGVHLQTSSGTDLAYNTQNFDTNGYHIYTATFVMKSGQKLYCYENALSNNWGSIIFVKSEGQS